MNYSKHLIIVFLTLFVFSACQKELNFDYSAPSVGSLQANLSFECVGDSVYGNYQKDSVLNSSNYIDVKANVTTVGTYTILSDTIDGFYFKGEGTFGSVGINKVRLKGYGTPIENGLFHFTISYNNSFCTAEVLVQDNININEAVIQLGGQPNSCSGAVLSGTYMQTLPMSSNNNATLSITVLTGGSYSIATPYVNGVSFSAAGIANLGDNTLLLAGTGTPTTSGTFNYTVICGSSTCTFSVTFLPAAPSAVYSIGGITGSCNATPHGTYTQGVPTNSSDSVTLTVNVTSTGTYQMTTGEVNGVTFAANGVFTVTGYQSVTLYASGTPITAAPYQFLYTLGNGCTFSIPVTGNYIICNLDGVFTTFNYGASAGLTSQAGGTLLSIDGSQFDPSTSDPSINIQISKPGSIVADSINVNTSGVALSCDYYDASSIDFVAMTGTSPQTNPFTVIITSITTSIPARIKGRFYGPVKDNNGAGPGQKTITLGYFDLPLNQ